MSQWQQEAVKNASRLVGSHSDTEFDIRFNPDVFSPGVKHEASPEEMDKQKLLIKNAAKFLITHQIPILVSGCFVGNRVSRLYIQFSRGVCLRDCIPSF